uniref:Uncharacterized protein n=1 Tax=Staphylococcus phage HS12 TaxID=3056402 RepID=A0AA50A6X6_9VIRU|nr:MAG: hypothetical protein [Staphylococcus phage HS12]DAL16198.1 MAG TPA_asm: hypothetical protein [Caudoviricetes sp.]
MRRLSINYVIINMQIILEYLWLLGSLRVFL